MVHRTRRCLALAAGAVLAAPAATHAGAEPWDGVWDTVHQFGNPALVLTQEKKSEPGPQVYGSFRVGGDRTGKIHGDLSDKGYTWSGTYKDNTSGDKGKFRVELEGNLVRFEGWYRSCPDSKCGPKITWTGEHA